MKIIAIRGKNLASLEDEFVIDFTKEPLLSSGLFAIVGNTGAGKSTILDTICLALYDEVPRFSSAESKSKDDSSDGLSQRDTRNILHKGAVDGFAEVDFRAINGYVYRSRWSVRRSRNKVDGTLQATNIELYNLSTSQDVQGKKTELLKIIENLVGLEYNQFTRAVLLAQGSFENFIKAKENEKAELLEKLTGTDIYSEISKRIFDAYTLAKADMELLQKQAQSIELLPEETLVEIQHDRDQLTKRIASINDLLVLLNKQEQWWEEELKLTDKIKEIEIQQANSEQLISQAQPRINYLQLIDRSQEIREPFVEVRRLNAEKEQQNKQLQQEQQIFKTNSDNIKLIEEQFEKYVTQKSELEKRHQEAKPKIDRAKELDIQIDNQNAIKDNNQAEIDKLVNQSRQIMSKTEELNNELNQITQQLKTLNTWFEDKAGWVSIVENQQAIVLHIDRYDEVGKALSDEAKMILLAQQSLQTKEDQLSVDTEELKILNDTQPSEIILLRKSLISEHPCPVCGSIEHPYSLSKDQEIGLRQEELEKKKILLQNKIDQTKKLIETNKSNLLRYNVNKENLQKILQESIIIINGFLLRWIPDWEKNNNQGLSNKLKPWVVDVVKQWDLNKATKDKSSNRLETLQIQIKDINENLVQLQAQLDEKNKVVEQISEQLKNKTTERLSIFDGQAIQMIENKYEARIKDLEQKINKERTDKDNINKIIASSGAIVKNLQDQLESNEKHQRTLNETIEDWLKQQDDISMEILSALTSKKVEWIVEERKSIEGLLKNKIVIDTTRKERKADWVKHQDNINKPQQNKQKQQITDEIQESTNERVEINKQLLDLEVKIKNQIQNRERLSKLEKEMSVKNDLCNQWAKLNDLLGSRSGDKFKRIAQGYTLDLLLDYANVHLQNLNKRFTLQKISNSLVLQVVDNDMFGEVRPVHGLSGGESFLISLALALGLSSLSSNQMNIESLFIDEGFGSLDMDTLNVAMEALENLQMQGRKIGVISHVDSMKERINTQVQVVKTANGSSSIIKIVS